MLSSSNAGASVIMSQPVTIPIFGSSSTQHPQQGSSDAVAAGGQQHDGAVSSEWYEQMDDDDQDVDFDLLAEYLLEENPTMNQTGGVSIEFNNDYIVSPEQSVDGGAAQQAKDIITQHANTIATTTAAAIAATNGAPVSPPPLLIAPPAPAPPQIAAQGMAVPVPTTITQYAATSSSQPGFATTTVGASRTKVSTKAVAAGQKKTAAGTTENKRRRTNPPQDNNVAAVAAQGLIDASSYLTNPVNMSPAVVAAAAAAAAMQGRGRKKTQAQIDRRRERNRILARRTRLRKKFFFESLQKEVIELQRENAALKDIVRTEVAVESEDGRKLLEGCNAARQLPREVLEACGEDPDSLDQQDFNLITSIQQSQHSFVITDPSLQDNPIVFASDDFVTLTGYSREDILGRNCRFLQGAQTSKDKLDIIRKGLSTGDDVSVTLINYTADGQPFWNKLFIAALRDAQNNIVNFIGVIVKVASPEPGDPEFGKTIIGSGEGEEQQQQQEEENVASAATAASVVENPPAASAAVVESK